MNIGGLTPFSSIDFEGRISAVVYTQGCNFRCVYCHNHELIPRKIITDFSLESVFRFLDSRKKILDGICLTGGEPTLHRDLPKVLEKIKDKGFALKLDTNGSNPKMLELLFSKVLVDYVAMDIKAPWNKYKKIIKVNFPIEIIKESFELIKSSNFPHEFRTTVHSKLLSPSDLEEIIRLVGKEHPLYFQIAKETPLFKVQNRYTKETLNTFISQFPSFKLAVR